MSTLSLTTTGTPSNAPTWPARRRASAASASVRAFSARIETNAFIRGFSRSIRVRYSSTSSRGVTSPARTSSPSRATPANARSSLTAPVISAPLLSQGRLVPNARGIYAALVGGSRDSWHGEHRTRRNVKQTQRHAPENQPSDRPVTTRAHDNQICADLISDIGNLVRGLRSDVIHDLESGIESLGREPIHHCLEPGFDDLLIGMHSEPALAREPLHDMHRNKRRAALACERLRDGERSLSVRRAVRSPNDCVEHGEPPGRTDRVVNHAACPLRRAGKSGQDHISDARYLPTRLGVGVGAISGIHGPHSVHSRAGRITETVLTCRKEPPLRRFPRRSARNR